MLLIHCSEFIQAQYYFSPVTPRCFIGPYRITYNCSLPISFGYSSVSNTKYNTSSNFKSINYGKSLNNFFFDVKTASGYSDGDYFSFVGTSPFTIAWGIQPAFYDIDESRKTIEEVIEPSGFYRFYTEELLDPMLSLNTIYISSTNQEEFTLNIAFTWEETEKPTYTTLLITEKSPYPHFLNVPPSAIWDGKAPVFVHLKCSSHNPCHVQLGFNVDNSTSGSGVIALILAILGCCVCCGCCGIGICCFVRIRRITMRGIATNPAEKYQTVIVLEQKATPPQIVYNMPIQAQNYHQKPVGGNDVENQQQYPTMVTMEPTPNYYLPTNTEPVTYNSGIAN